MRLVALAVVAALGCGKSEKPGQMDRPTDPPKDRPKPLAAISSFEEYRGAGLAFMRELRALLDEPDCDKLAPSIAAFADGARVRIEMIEAWEAAHPDDKQRMSNEIDAESKEGRRAFEAARERCAGHAAFLAAIAKLPP